MGTVETMETLRAGAHGHGGAVAQVAVLEARSVSARQPDAACKRLIRLNQVESLTGLKKSHIYGLMREGGFPKRVVLSRRCVAFVESEVVAWLDARVAERDAA